MVLGLVMEFYMMEMNNFVKCIIPSLNILENIIDIVLTTSITFHTYDNHIMYIDICE